MCFNTDFDAFVTSIYWRCDVGCGIWAPPGIPVDRVGPVWQSGGHAERDPGRWLCGGYQDAKEGGRGCCGSDGGS